MGGPALGCVILKGNLQWEKKIYPALGGLLKIWLTHMQHTHGFSTLDDKRINQSNHHKHHHIVANIMTMKNLLTFFITYKERIDFQERMRKQSERGCVSQTSACTSPNLKSQNIKKTWSTAFVCLV